MLSDISYTMIAILNLAYICFIVPRDVNNIYLTYTPFQQKMYMVGILLIITASVLLMIRVFIDRRKRIIYRKEETECLKKEKIVKLKSWKRN
jgi:hypothetical protein